jgi:Ca2+-binding EF-hand superfamily protein
MGTKPKTERFHNFTLTDLEKQELRQAFNLFDKDGGGRMEANEIRVILRVLGFNPTLEELRQIIAQAGLSESSTLDFTQFRKVLLRVIGEPASTESLVRSFNNLDIDMDGSISLEDLAAVAEDLGQDLSQEELLQIILCVRGGGTQLDIHTKDCGKISQNDFISTINKSLDR